MLLQSQKLESQGTIWRFTSTTVHSIEITLYPGLNELLKSFSCVPDTS